MFRRAASALAILAAANTICGAAENSTEEFDAKVIFVKQALDYQGSAYVVDSDARWVVRLQRQDGNETTYLIHSPTIKLHASAESAIGQTFCFRETIRKSEYGKPRRTLERINHELAREP